MQFLTQSHQVFFGYPLCLIPSTSHVIKCLTQSLSSFRSMCPNHLNHGGTHHTTAERSSLAAHLRKDYFQTLHHGIQMPTQPGTTAPAYLSDQLQQVLQVESRWHLRSSSTSSLVIPVTRRSMLGDRAFPVSATRA